MSELRSKNLRRRFGRLGEAGQSTIEFALMLTLCLGFVMFFVRLSLVMAYGNLVQYAAFMSARAYQSAGPGGGDDDQKDRATRIIVKLLKKSEGQTGTERFPQIAQAVGGTLELPGASIGPGPQYQSDNRDLSWQVGVRYSFRSRLFSAFFGKKVTPKPVAKGAQQEGMLSLTSEAWLGREPSEDECMSEMGAPREIDNGC